MDLKPIILSLQEKGHLILLMLDANATLADTSFSDFAASCSLVDLHSSDPAPSTYIGSDTSRIDYMFGCVSLQSHITRSGTLSYTEGPQSDHRGLFVDLSLDFLLIPPAPIAPAHVRGIHTGNPEHVAVYNEAVLSYYTQHRMVERIDDLYKHHNTMSRAQVREVLTKWDDDNGRAQLHAERLLLRPPKKYSWSPELRNAAMTRRYWKQRLRELQHSEDYSSTCTRWQTNIQALDPSFQFPLLGVPLTLSAVRHHFNRASRTFRHCQRSSLSLRMQSYEDLLIKYEDDEDPLTKTESRRKARIVKHTIDGETTRHTFRNIRTVVKPSTAGSLSKVLVPRLRDASGPVPASDTYRILQDTDPEDIIWETIVDRSEIESYLLGYNKASFRAAADSPCGHGVVHDSITFSSLSASSSDLLRGMIPPTWHGDDLHFREFLASFTIPPQVQDAGPLSSSISAEDIRRGFQSWRESTSTSPSGRHLGHYKALIQHPVLLNCFVQFLNITTQRGIAVPRWCNATNVLIEKDVGRPKINRLRIIHLFEADFNFFLKLQWGHRLVRRGLSLSLLHDGQHGSIPTRTSIDPVMLTQLTSDLCQVLKHDLARFDNDASACYDRIIVALAMLAARKCGMPPNAVRLHADALRLMRYTVKTMYGISEANYHGTLFEPLFGTGQGSGASPSAWLSLVVLLLQTIDRLVPERMAFTSGDGTITHSRLVDAYVDDTSLGFTSSSDQSTSDLISRLQSIAQTWEHLLSYRAESSICQNVPGSS